MKKLISILLAVIISLSMIPFSGNAVFVQDKELIDIDIFKAQCMAGIAEDNLSNAVAQCNNLYNYYINDNIYSPTQTFLDTMYADESLMALYETWKMYNLEKTPSAALQQIANKEDYYESLIIGMYQKALVQQSNMKELLNNKILNDSKELVATLCDITSAADAAELSEIMDLSDPETYAKVTEAIENKYLSGISSKIVGNVSLIFEVAENVVDALDRISVYASMAELDESAKLWLQQLYDSCGSDFPVELKNAVSNLKDASMGFADAALVSIKENTFSLSLWAFDSVINSGIQAAAALNPITNAVMIGLTAGKTICNIFFGSDDIYEQLYLMECIYEIQNLSRRVAENCKNTFVNDQTKENALAFNYAVDCYYESIINIDIDCMKSFLDKLYNGGIDLGSAGGVLDLVISWVYGTPDDYDDAVNALESLRGTRITNKKNLEAYFWAALDANHPETYDYYFPDKDMIPVTSLSFLLGIYILPDEYADQKEPGKITMLEGDDASYWVDYSPEEADLTDYTISVSDPEIIQIKDGVVLALKPGNATVTVTSTADDHVFDTAEIKVIERIEESASSKFTYTISGNEVTITGLAEGYEPTELVIPSTIEGYPVAKIGDFAFMKNKYMKSVIFPSSVSEIGIYAFYNCSSLTQINFTEGLKTIDDGAFSGCTALASAILPYTVTDLGISVFENCSSLYNVQLSNNITELKDRTFYNCDTLEEITISKYVTKFGQGIFGGCNSLKKVLFDSNKNATSYKQIYRASDTLQNIKSITISNSVKIIDTSCFYGTDLYSVTIPDSINGIGGYVGDYSDLNHIFYEGTESSWVSLMSRASQYGSIQTLSRIKDAGHIHFEVSLQNNTTVKDEIAPTCTADGSNNIYCNICNELIGSEIIPTTGHIGKLVQKVLPTCTEQGYSKYYCIVCGEEYITDYVNATHQHNYDENGSCCYCDHNVYFDYSISNEEVTITGYLTDKTTITIPNHIEFLPVKHIANNAFEGCTVIENIKLSNSITSIGERAFSDCTSIENIDIPDSVISIGTRAFSNCSNLETITIGSAVTSIGNYAFADCINVVQINYNATDASENINADSYNLFENAGTSGEGIKVNIGNNVKTIPENLFWSHNQYLYVPPKIISATIGRNVETIGDGAFARCSDLANINFSGNKLTNIEDEAFSGCSFTSISFPNSLKNIGWRSFAGCPFETLIIPDSVTSIGIGAFDCETIKVVDTGNGVLNLDGFDFSECYELESVIIGDSVTIIPDSMFAGRQKLKSLVLGEKLNHIGKNAFQDCTGLTKLIIPNSVTTIDLYAFEGCTSLTAITLGKNITSLGQSAFENCTNIRNIIIPDALVSIGSSAFKNCTMLETVDFGTSVKDIGDNAFNNCTSISTFVLPVSVTTVGEKAFYNCCISGTLTIPESVSHIGEDAFYGNNVTTLIYNAKKCYMSFYDEYLDPDSSSFNNNVAVSKDFSIFPNCTEIIFGDNVTFIPTSLIANNANITSVNLPDDLQRIQPVAFGNCSSLTEITLPESITSVGFCAFENTPWLNNQPDGILYIGTVAYDYIGYSWSVEEITIKAGTTRIESSAFADCYNLNSVIIPESVTSIGDSAFSGCECLTTIYLPDTVTDIGNSAFNGCKNLIAVSVSDNNENYLSEDGVLYNKEKSVIIDYPDGKPGEYIIPNTIIAISDDEFSNCVNMTSVIIPESVKSIGEYAFYFCDSLTSITISSGVEIIDETAFDYCNNLCTIIVDNNNTNFSSIDGVLYNKEITDIVHFPKGKSGVFLIPNTVTSIDCEFWSCEKLTAIAIPNSVVEISDSPFFGCYELTEINVDTDNAYFTSIDGVLFNKNITTIITYPNAKSGDYAIPTSVMVINQYAFQSSDKLTSLVIPEGVTSIPDNAFLGCSNVESISIPKSILEVGVWPFGYCNMLKDVYFAGTSDDWANITFDGDSGLSNDIFIHYNTSLPHYDLGTITKEATCTIDGEITYVCPCGYVKTETIPALGHSGTDVEIIEPTCTSDGYTLYKCSVCGEEYKDNWVYCEGHQKGEIIKTIPATCTSDGYKLYRCSVCGEEFEADWTWVDHAYEIKVAECAATCTERGYIEYKCATCDDTYIEYTEDALGHVFENNVCTRCGMLQEDCIESEHPYADDMDKTYTLYKEGAQSIAVTFSADTYVEEGYDYIYIYDANDNLVGTYTGDELSSKKIVVAGNTVKIRLTSDSSYTEYGFSISKVETDIKQEIIDKETGITVSEETLGTLPSNTILVIDELLSASDSITYDISLQKDGEEIRPNGTVTVKIPVPEGMDGTACKVYRQEDDGTYTDMNAVYQNGYMVFTTDYFNRYVLTTGDPSASEATLGDVTGDGIVDAADAVMIQRYDAGLINLSVNQLQAADVTGDGTVDAADAVRIQRYDAGLISSL